MRGIPEETKARILKAITKLFYANGIRAIGVDAIAAEAGVTKRTLYHHFESKDALIAAYLEARHEPLLGALIRSIDQVEGGLEARIEGLFAAIASQAENKAWHGCPFVRAISEFRETNNVFISNIAARHKHAFEQWLETHFAESAVCEPQLLARQIMVLVDGAITQVLIHRDAAYASAASNAAVALLRQQVST